jgi:hypothetical protein
MKRELSLARNCESTGILQLSENRFVTCQDLGIESAFRTTLQDARQMSNIFPNLDIDAENSISEKICTFYLYILPYEVMLAEEMMQTSLPE